jgi:hypothetical protein
VGNYSDANGFTHGFLADPVPGNSAADPASSPALVNVPNTIATPSVVLVTVPLTQLTPTPTPLPAIVAPATPSVQVGVGVGSPFNGVTTAVLTAPTMTSGADGGGHSNAGITGNDLFVSNFDLLAKEVATL